MMKKYGALLLLFLGWQWFTDRPALDRCTNCCVLDAAPLSVDPLSSQQLPNPELPHIEELQRFHDKTTDAMDAVSAPDAR
ncbi:MAG: hypothetical protein NXI32_14185 [bacterium]|nr:hypothetical protein [bacterium]